MVLPTFPVFGGQRGAEGCERRSQGGIFWRASPEKPRCAVYKVRCPQARVGSSPTFGTATTRAKCERLTPARCRRDLGAMNRDGGRRKRSQEPTPLGNLLQTARTSSARAARVVIERELWVHVVGY